MNKLYFIAPLVALAIFAAVYSRYAKAYDARIEQEGAVLIMKFDRCAIGGDQLLQRRGFT